MYNGTESDDERKVMLERVVAHLPHVKMDDLESLVDAVILPSIEDAYTSGLTAGWQGGLNEAVTPADLFPEEVEAQLSLPL